MTALVRDAEENFMVREVPPKRREYEKGKTDRAHTKPRNRDKTEAIRETIYKDRMVMNLRTEVREEGMNNMKQERCGQLVTLINFNFSATKLEVRN